MKTKHFIITSDFAGCCPSHIFACLLGRHHDFPFRETKSGQKGNITTSWEIIRWDLLEYPNVAIALKGPGVAAIEVRLDPADMSTKDFPSTVTT